MKAYFVNSISVLVLSIFVLGLAGCQDKSSSQSQIQTAVPLHDLEYWTKPENRSALKNSFDACNNNPGELGHTPSCINVMAAQSRVDMLVEMERNKAFRDKIFK